MQTTVAMQTRVRRRRASRHVRAPLRRNIDESTLEQDEREIIIGGDDRASEP